MGMFSSIFGSTSSDKADKARQDALNAFNAIKTPELSALQVQLDKYVNAGQLTPQEAETQLLSSNAFNNIVTDPSYVGAQKQALQQLQSVATQGGLTAVDRAQLNDINNAQNQQNKSQNEATMQQAQQRGVGGSDLNQVNQLINEQGAADRAANSGVQVAANAQQRALQAMQAAGQTGSQLESQAYGEQANKAQSQNAIDLYNKQALNQTNLYNTQTANAAQAANLANAQAINNANTSTANANKEYNAQQNQTLYGDQMQKANAIAGVDTNAANAAQDAYNRDQQASLGLVEGGLQAGGTALGGAFGGPAGAAAANTALSGAKKSPTNESDVAGGGGYNPNAYTNENQFYDGGEVSDPDHPAHMAHGGHVHCYSHGGQAYHHPECMNQGGAATPADPISPDVKQSFMSGMMNKPKPSMPIEWNQGSGKWELRDKTGNKLGDYSTYVEAAGAANQPQQPTPQVAAVRDYKGGEIKDFRAGGHVPGKAQVPGDSPKNDTVDAKLSPGEIVVPRSAANDEEEFNKFMAKFVPKKKGYATGGKVEEPTKSDSADVSSPTRTATETGGSSPGGASTGGVGSGIGGAGTGGAATGGASTGGAGTVNVTISGNSTTKGSKGADSKSGSKSSAAGDGGNDKKSPITINISNVGGKTDAGNVASGDGPGASGAGGSGKGSGGGGGGAAPSEPKDLGSFLSDDNDQTKMAAGGVVPLGIPRVNDTNPMRDTARSSMTNPVPLAATNDANDFAHMMAKMKPPKKPKAPAKVSLESQALANLQARGRKV